MVLINSNGLTYARDSIKCKHKANYPQELCESSIGTYYIHRGLGAVSCRWDKKMGGRGRLWEIFPAIVSFRLII